MRYFLMIVLMAGLAACDNSSKMSSELDSAKKKLDTTLNRIENSETMDSIKSKGGRILDTVKRKGGQLIDNVEEKFNDIKKKDSSQ